MDYKKASLTCAKHTLIIISVVIDILIGVCLGFSIILIVLTQLSKTEHMLVPAASPAPQPFPNTIAQAMEQHHQKILLLPSDHY